MDAGVVNAPEQKLLDASCQLSPITSDKMRKYLITETKVRRVEPDITVVELSGRLHLGNLLSSTETFLKRLIDEGARKLAIDASRLEFIDSSGIGMLVGCNGHIEQNGGRMRIAGAQGVVAKSFEVVHMDRIVPLDEDVESACRNFSAGSASSDSA
jgi:anti-sigma B factor antagonist